MSKQSEAYQNEMDQAEAERILRELDNELKQVTNDMFPNDPEYMSDFVDRGNY